MAAAVVALLVGASAAPSRELTAYTCGVEGCPPPDELMEVENHNRCDGTNQHLVSLITTEGSESAPCPVAAPLSRPERPPPRRICRALSRGAVRS